MMDHFREEAVSQHRKGLNEIMYYFAIVLMVFSGFLGLM